MTVQWQSPTRVGLYVNEGVALISPFNGWVKASAGTSIPSLGALNYAEGNYYKKLFNVCMEHGNI